MSNEKPLNRRDFLAVSGVPLLASAAATAQGQTGVQAPGLVIREKMPENLEFPFSSLNSEITPNARFYVRSHFAVPALDPAAWRLKVQGAVETPLDLTYDDLLRMDQKTVPATLECAGNSRVFLSPAVKGAQWELGAVSHAEWTGVPLGAVLKRAGLRADALEVVLEGADSGEIKDPPKPAGAIHFARSLPIGRAVRPDVLLALRMNGDDLPVSHGFPLRAVVPGWYGMASIKWLTRIVVVTRPFQGFFQTIDYARWDEVDGMKTRVPLTEMQVKSEIARPEMGEVVAAGSSYRVFGAAWTSDSEITKVEIAQDTMDAWSPARLIGRSQKNTWRFWEYNWTVPTKRGRHTLMARATDARGRTQPLQRQPDTENYVIHHVLPITVEVR